MFAVIRSGQVVNVVNVDADQASKFATENPDYDLADVSAVSPQPEIGWTYAGGTFSPPPAPPAPPSGPTPDQVAQQTFNTTLTGITTSTITDPAAKAAIQTIIATLTGSSGNVVVHAHPTTGP